jgi:putative transposase
LDDVAGVYRRLAKSAEDRQSAYRSLFKSAISKHDLTQIRDCTNKGWALGSDQFKARMEKLTQRPVMSKGVGRSRSVIANSVGVHLIYVL